MLHHQSPAMRRLKNIDLSGLYTRNHNKSTKNHEPAYSICCRNGQVHLPPERQPPPFLQNLLSGGRRTNHFKKIIRIYNSLFAFTSLDGKVDNRINRGGAPYTFKLHGHNYHLIGSICPVEGETPKYCQLYIYDIEHEVENRRNVVAGSDSTDPEIMEGLLMMLNQHNILVHGFRMARERFKNDEPEECTLKLLSSYSAFGRPNPVGPSNEVGALIVRDLENSAGWKDIVVMKKNRKLKRIYETNRHYMQLQYPIMFPFGDDGFHPEIKLQTKQGGRPRKLLDPDVDPEETKHREFVSLREYYAYKLMIRPNEALTPHLCGRLWQQYIVDAFTAVEQYRLDWVRTHQTTIRTDLYSSIRDSLRKGDTDTSHVGKNIILPATFTGSKRYMSQYFKDSLAICRSIGHPTFFLTMTTNTKWPEIQRMLDLLPGVDVGDAPDVVARVFKMKVDQLVDLNNNIYS
ncbi:uncharacterized protein LOC141716794 isoform X1 [Apium graveolens]|uniref:uncharacterized protein LOC141716794 isoform X1 n=1 Tax=Apium graveolens TaxID=4045 RepID=UPI003D7A06EA